MTQQLKAVKVSHLLKLVLDKKLEEAQSDVERERVMMQLGNRLSQDRNFLNSIPPGPGRARLVHAMLEKIHANHDQVTAERFSCHKGCSYCCQMYVTCTDDEAELLAEVAKKNKIKIDMARLAKQAGKLTDDYTSLGRKDASCVFLSEKGTCNVYQHRPAACRNYMVNTPPRWCDTHNGTAGDRDVAGVWREAAEFLASAAMTLDEDQSTQSSLATKLWRILKEK